MFTYRITRKNVTMTSEPKYTPPAIHPHPGIRLIFMSFKLSRVERDCLRSALQKAF